MTPTEITILLFVAVYLIGFCIGAIAQRYTWADSWW